MKPLSVDAWKKLIEKARAIKLTDAERVERVRSFAYGNLAIERPIITRDMIDRVADDLVNINRSAKADKIKST